MAPRRKVMEISVEAIAAAVADMSAEANFELPGDVLAALRAARDAETSVVARDVLGQLIENARIAHEQRIALCQDCGIAVVFAEHVHRLLGVESSESRVAITTCATLIFLWSTA